MDLMLAIWDQPMGRLLDFSIEDDITGHPFIFQMVVSGGTNHIGHYGLYTITGFGKVPGHMTQNFLAEYDCDKRKGTIEFDPPDAKVIAEKARWALEIIFRMVRCRNESDTHKFFQNFEYAKRIYTAKSEKELEQVVKEMNE